MLRALHFVRMNTRRSVCCVYFVISFQNLKYELNNCDLIFKTISWDIRKSTFSRTLKNRVGWIKSAYASAGQSQVR